MRQASVFNNIIYAYKEKMSKMPFESDNKMDKWSIKSASLVKQENLCRNVGTIVEGLRRCFSVGRIILTFIGVDKVFVGHKRWHGINSKCKKQLLI